MAVIRFAGFAGENRAVEPKLLADSVCTVSRNQKPGRGDLRPWKTAASVATVPSGQATIYRMGRDNPVDNQYWLTWNTIVKAVRGFTSDDTTEQTFYTGDGVPKFTNNIIGLASAPYPTTSRPMGLPAPLTAVTFTNQDQVVADLGKYAHLLAESYVSQLKAGDILLIALEGGSDQPVTMVNGPASAVTPTTVAAEINSHVTGVTATVIAPSATETGGVRLLSTAVGTKFTVKFKADTAKDYDPANVTYTDYKSNTSSSAVVASVSITAANITAMTPGQRFQVTVNGEQPVSCTVLAGSSTYPPAVTAATVRSAFSIVNGLEAEEVIASDHSRSITLKTTLAAAGVSINIKIINPKETAVSVTVGEAKEVAVDDTVTLSVYYVYTYVNDLGWESAPSPVSAECVRFGEATALLAGFAAPPSGNYNITTIRVYKTQTGTGSTNFFYLREFAVGDTTVADDNRDLGELLETTTWLPAPGVPTGGVLNATEPNLSNLTAMWNGMMAGITGKAVRVCEPYIPYAWPKAFEVLPPDSKPVALGVFGQAMLVLTTGRPVLVSGSGPDGLDQQMVEMPQACVSARSVVSMGAGVAWASEDGLCWFGAGGPKIITAGIMLREDWQALVPSSIIGQMYEGLYFGSYDDGTGRKGFFIDPSSPQGIYFMDTGYSTMHFDELRDHLYVLDGTSVKKWDAGNSTLTYRVVSKIWKQQYPVNYGAAEVIATAYPVTFKLYADGTLKHTETVASRSPFRLPAGFRAFDYQIELEGTAPIQGVALASTMQELSAV